MPRMVPRGSTKPSKERDNLQDQITLRIRTGMSQYDQPNGNPTNLPAKDARVAGEKE